MFRTFLIVSIMIMLLCDCIPVSSQDKGSVLPDEQGMYTASIIAELSKTRKDLENMRTRLDREDQKIFKGYNAQLIKISEDHIKVNEKLLKAVRKGEIEDMEKLERQRKHVVHTKNVAELNREMAVTVFDYERRAQAFPDDYRLKTAISNLKSAYRDIVDAQIMLYEAETRVRDVYGKKHKAVDLLEMYIADSADAKK